MLHESVHVLVCSAFHGERPSSKHQAAHIDGNSMNNARENLYWATVRENHADKKRHGTQPSGAQINTAVLSRGDVEWIRAYPMSRSAVREMAERLLVNGSTIRNVLNGTGWKNA